MKGTEADHYNFAEYQLNDVGYFLLHSDRVAEAIQIFSLNAETYSESSNAYDSLGEAYMIDGNNELAIANYKKSLELNPRNANAEEMLKKLVHKDK